MKHRLKSLKQSFKVEIVYADKNAQHSFGLLADLIFEEIMRKRKAITVNNLAGQETAIDDATTRSPKEPQ